MRLEDAVELPVGIIGSRAQCRLDLRGMMRVIINDREPVPGAQKLETALGSDILVQGGCRVFAGDPEPVRRSGSRYGIIDIVLSGNAQGDLLPEDGAVGISGVV